MVSIVNLLNDAGTDSNPAVAIVRDVVKQVLCANGATLSAAVRGKVGLFGALPHFIHSFQECGADFGDGTSGGAGAGVDFSPGGGFTGGQCPVNYTVSWSAPMQSGAVIQSSSLLMGPIGEAIFAEGNGDGSVPTGFGRGSIPYGPNGEIAHVAFGQNGNWITGFSITGVVRQDGGADNCGSISGSNPALPPPTVFPPDAPVDGDGRIIVLPPSGPVTTNVIFNGDFYNVTVDIGEITVNDEGDLRIPIDGFPIDVTPFLDIIDPSDEIKDIVADLLTDLLLGGNEGSTDIQALADSLDCVISDSCTLQSVQTSVDVWGDIPRQSVIEASGNALVIGILQNTLEIMNESLISICEALNKTPVVESPVLLLSETADIAALSGTPVLLPENTGYVDVLFDHQNLQDQLYKVGNDGELQGRFGYLIWGWGDVSDRKWGEPAALWFSRNRVALPQGEDAPRWCRVSSHPRHEYQVWGVAVSIPGN